MNKNKERLLREEVINEMEKRHVISMKEAQLLREAMTLLQLKNHKKEGLN